MIDRILVLCVIFVYASMPTGCTLSQDKRPASVVYDFERDEFSVRLQRAHGEGYASSLPVFTSIDGRLVEGVLLNLDAGILKQSHAGHDTWMVPHTVMKKPLLGWRVVRVRGTVMSEISDGTPLAAECNRYQRYDDEPPRYRVEVDGVRVGYER
ncbi:MAG: hypothetical protein ACX94C_14500 [Phycisphaerales bacterium]